jgi:transcriptional regulator with XRE-family HTH domain
MRDRTALTITYRNQHLELVICSEQLADRAGISRGVLSRHENGGEGVSLESFLRVLRALGVLESLTRALDPYESDVGRLRSNEVLPKRIRPSPLTS